MSDLYLPEGWPNIPYIDSLGCWLNILVSARQVGKTYSVLKYLIEENRTQIFMRRTRKEIKSISSSMILNPFETLKKSDIHVMLTGSADTSMEIVGYDEVDGKREPNNKFYGIATSMTEMAAIRGFNGAPFSDWVLDEFIPEKLVITREAEGDGFLNAHITINGNRELEGLPPVKTWLLANTNRINSPILDALNIIDDILYMRRKGLEEYITPNNVFIGLLKSEKVIEKRKQTVLMKQISKKSDFYGMAIESEWAYDESPYVKTMPLKNLRPVWSYDNTFTCWETPNGYYICRAAGKVPTSCRYDGTRTGRERLEMEWSVCKLCYYAGCMVFSDLKALAVFKTIFGID